MIAIDTLADLRAAWRSIVAALRRDLGAPSRLAADPVATFRDLGCELSPTAASALQAAMT